MGVGWGLCWQVWVVLNLALALGEASLATAPGTSHTLGDSPGTGRGEVEALEIGATPRHNIASDKWVLNVADNGYNLQLTEIPKTPFHERNHPADEKAKLILDKEAAVVIEKGAAVIVEHSPMEITSGYFARPIVNLKYLNKHCRKVSFKMTTVADIRNSIQPDYHFVSIDLTDACYSVPLHESAWQYVHFVWNGVVYVLLFGLAPSPRVFKKW